MLSKIFSWNVQNFYNIKKKFDFLKINYKVIKY